MAAVTIPGLSGAAVTVTGPNDVTSLAQLVANALILSGTPAGGPGVVGSETASINGSMPPAPVSPPGGAAVELVVRDTVPGALTVPSGYNYTVIDDPNAPSVTASNQVVVSNATTGSGVYTLFGNSTVVAAGGNNVIYTGTGTYQIATGDGNDAILANGAGFISTGGGTNVVRSGGADVVYSSGINDFIVAAGQGDTVMASGNGTNIMAVDVATLTASLTGSGDVVVGSPGAPGFAGGMMSVVAANGGADAISGGSGVMYVDDGNTADTIGAGNASTANIGLYGDHSVLFGGTGVLNATVGGTANTLVGGSGTATVTAFAGGIASVTGNVVAVGDGALTFLGGPQNATVFGGTGDLTYVGGTGGGTIVGSGSGTEMVTVGSGGVQFSAGVGNQATISNGAGAGITTLFGSSNNSDITFNGSVGSAIYVAGVGNETLNAAGSSTSNFIVGSLDPSSQDSLVGGSGNNTVLAGAGSDTIVTGSGNNSLVFFQSNTAGQHDYITNFTANDSLFVLGYDSTQSAAYLVNNATTGPNGVTLKLSDNTQITFTNMSDTAGLNGKILYA